MEKNHTQLWDECRAIIRDNIPPEQYDAWFKDVTSLSYTENSLTLNVPSAFFVEQLEERYIKLIAAVIRRVYGGNVKLFYNYNQVSNDPATGVNMRSSNPSPAVSPAHTDPANPFQPATHQNIDPQLNPKYTFENYCGSTSNLTARSIGEAIANNPKLKTFNPLFVFGPTGVGKTHLIQAIGIRIKENNPQARVLYVTARLFESQYTAALNNKRINDFFQFYQSIDTLIIDDVQDLAKKPSTQNTFYHIFNHLHQNQKQIIMSSDCPPSQMEGIEARLLSRFKWGMSASLERPDLNLRKDVLTMRAEQDGLQIPADVLEYIAENVTDSIRELEGIIASLIAYATILNQDITIDLARSVLANAIKVNKRQVNFELITQEVSNYYNIDPDFLFTKSRKREISDARQMVMYFAKKLAKMPLTAIGTRLSRTHATVLYACKNIEERLHIEKQLLEDVNKIENALIGNNAN
jgi:chromosomal replication initiator protein